MAKRTYEAAAELFAMLCRQYNLNPTADGVIISHREGHSRGIASNHGDPEHLWTQLGMGYTMDTFRRAVKAAMDGGSSAETSGYTKIMGTAVATAEQMKTYIRGKNPQVPQSVLDMIPLYLSEGQAEGVRGDIAFAQSCLETGNFTFSGSAVTLDQNNFCGMGVTSNGLKGNSFDTPQLGIRAQIQHLKAYASTDALQNDCVDPRFKYVIRGSAEYVEWLGQQDNPQGKGWATGAGYTVDFLNKKRVQNKGIVPQYYVENSHEPIIPRDLYMQVQEEMIRRANLHSGANRKKRVYSSKYALSSIVYCSKCGEIYRRIAWNNRGKHSTVWRCCTRVEHGPTACDAPTIQESDLQAAVVQAINLTLGNRENMMVTLQENVKAVIRQEDETSSEGIEAKLLELQKELLKLANSKKDYNSVADEIDRLRELKQNALVESAEREGLKQRIREMRDFLEQQSTDVTEYDELLVRRLIEKVTVYDERFEVEFKSGAKVDVER